MDKQAYAGYLGKLIEDYEIDFDCDLSDQFYSYFQCFMPSGEKVEKVFEPLSNKEKLLERLLPIYKATEAKTLKQYAEGVSPGYFCPDITSNEIDITAYAKQHVEYLKAFASFSKDNELLEMLNEVKIVEVLENTPGIEDDTLNAHLYDAISDWGIGNINDEEPISLLSEAYYSINCDYYLSYYFQYPAFKNKPDIDFLKPYFKIWESGYYCKFDGEKLLLYK